MRRFAGRPLGIVRRLLAIASVASLQAAAQSGQDIPAARQAMAAGVAAVKASNLHAAKRQFSRAAALAPKIPQGHAALGSVLLSLREYTAAAKELGTAHALAPSDADIDLNLADAQAATGQYAEAVGMFREVLRAAHPPAFSAQDSLLFATALSATHEDASAEQALREAVTKEAGSAELHDALGTLLAKRGSMAEALEQFEFAIALRPELVKAQYHRGVALLALDRTAESVPVLEAVVRAQPRDFESRLQLGRALSSLHQDAPALDALHAAAKLRPAGVPADAVYSLAVALQASGDAAGAVPFFEEADRAGVHTSASLTNRALALVQIGDAKNALPLYQEALRLGPDEPTLRQDYGVAYLQQSDLDRAVEQFRAGLALDPSNAHLHYDLGLALKLKDDLAAAVPEFEHAAQLDPGLPDPAYTLGVIYMQQGRFGDAAEQLKRATALQPDNGDAWALLGSVLKNLDQTPGAMDALKRAITLEPDQPSLHIQLAALEVQSGNKEAAAQDRKIAADLSRSAAGRQRASFALNSGRSLLADGKLGEAVTQLKVAAAAAPALPEPHRLLADAYSRQGNTAGAAIERRMAASLAHSVSQSTGEPH